jgi:hypothetical protein
MNKALMSGTLTVDKVLAASRDLNLDQNDTQTYLKLASQLEASGGASARQSAPVAESLRQLADLVEHPYLEQGMIGGAGSSQYADQLKDKQAQAESAFIKEYYLKLVKSPEWDKLSFSEQHKQIEELRDSVAKSFGGPTMADYLKARPEALPKQEQIQPTVMAAKPQPAEGTTTPTSALAPVADPFAADLDRSVLRSVKQALTHRPDATTREAINAAFGDWRDTFEAMHGVTGMQGKTVMSEGRYGKYGLSDVASLEEYRTKNPTASCG